MLIGGVLKTVDEFNMKGSVRQSFSSASIFESNFYNDLKIKKAFSSG